MNYYLHENTVMKTKGIKVYLKDKTHNTKRNKL